MKSILVPINFSRASINGLRTALDIARQTNSRIIMLHNMDEHVGDDAVAKKDHREATAGYWHNINEHKDLPQRLELLRGLRIQYHVPKIKMEFALYRSLTREDFEQLVRKKEIQIIIAGMEQEQSKTDFILESISLHEGKIDLPILFVWDYYAQLKYDKILLVDDVINPDHELAQLVKAFGKALNCKVFATTYQSPSQPQYEAWRKSIEQELQGDETVFVPNKTQIAEQYLNRLIIDLQVDLAASTKSIPENLLDFDPLPIHQIDCKRTSAVLSLV